MRDDFSKQWPAQENPGSGTGLRGHGLVWKDRPEPAKFPRPLVLIIERDELLRWALTEAAGDSGYSTIAVPELATARGISDERMAHATVVLVDSDAAQGDAVGLAALRARLPASVLAVMTDDAASAVSVRLTGSGVSAIFVKPFDLHALQAYLHAIAQRGPPGGAHSVKTEDLY